MKRRLWQSAFVLLLNLPLIGEWKALCLPVLNCHSCPWAVFACPIGVIGHFIAWGLLPLFAIGTLVLLGAVFGRFFCGWICPFGFLQDLLYKIPSVKYTLKPWTRYIKYVILVVTVLLVPYFLGLESYAFFCRLCPAGTLQSLLPRTLADGQYQTLLSSWQRLSALVLILIFAIVSMRSFCKVVCPIGAILALFNRVSAFSIRYKQAKCPSCELCLKECPMDVKIEDFQTPEAKEVLTAPAECILCLNCTHNCRQSGLEFSIWNWKSDKFNGGNES